MMTKTRELFHAHEAKRRVDAQEMRVCAAAEFPVGTKVKWVRTYDRFGEAKYLHGVVTRQSDWRFRVRSAAGGDWNKEPYLLELDQSPIIGVVS